MGRVPDAARQACLSSRVSLALCSGHAAIEVIVPLWHERHTEEVIGAGGSRVDYRSAAGLTAVSAVASLLVPGERFELPTNGLQNRCSTTELTRQINDLRNRSSSIV